MAIRSAVLKYLRVNVNPMLSLENPSAVAAAGGLSQLIRRNFAKKAKKAKSSVLDRSEVTDRVLSIVKDFRKIDDPSKVTPDVHLFDLGLGLMDVIQIVVTLQDEFDCDIPEYVSTINVAVDCILAKEPRIR